MSRPCQSVADAVPRSAASLRSAAGARRQRLYDLLRQLAAGGEVCPRNDVLAARLGVSEIAIMDDLCRLRAEGRIVTSGGAWRVVRITEDGSATRRAGNPRRRRQPPVDVSAAPGFDVDADGDGDAAAAAAAVPRGARRGPAARSAGGRDVPPMPWRDLTLRTMTDLAGLRLRHDSDLYGDLAPAVLALRRAGWSVCRSETVGERPGLWRLGTRLVDADTLRAKAAPLLQREDVGCGC